MKKIKITEEGLDLGRGGEGDGCYDFHKNVIQLGAIAMSVRLIALLSAARKKCTFVLYIYFAVKRPY